MKKDFSPQNTTMKASIYYPREYRRFSKMRRSTWVYLILCVFPVTAAFIVFYSPITQTLCTWAAGLLQTITGETITNHSKEFLPWFGNIHYLGLSGGTPTFLHALISAIVCFVAFVILSQINNNARSLIIYLCMGLFVQFISSLYFVFLPSKFPYTLTDYSELYILQQIALWIMVSIICGIATALLNSSGISKVVTFFVTVGYSFIYGCVRYIVYLLIMYYFSLMYMATLFFTLGVLFDFLQLVAIYSIFARYTSKRMSTGRRRAEWLWS